jgi:hypothetical protein
MDTLNQIIAGMSKEDMRFYKLYALRVSASEPRKDIVLFDYMRKSGELYDDKRIFSELYGGKNKNAFYRLKNRLAEDLNQCLLSQHYYRHDILYVYHLLSLARLYFSKNNFGLSLRFIRKAETEATRIENHELLDIIYGEYIKLSHEIVSVNPEEYIKKRQENQKYLIALRQMDDILAAVTYRMKITQNFSEKGNDILNILQKTVDDFSGDTAIKKSPKLRLKICSAVSQILAQRRDYILLEKYLLKMYPQFKKEHLFTKENHDLKLLMLTYVVNALFKNKKIALSLKYAEELKEAMSEHGKLLYDKYLFFYYNSLVINYSVLDKDKAIAILEELKENKALKNSPFYEIFVNINLMILWFDKEEYHKSIRFLNKLYMHDNYKNTDFTLKFKIAMAEIIVRHELKDFEFLEHRIRQVNKEYRDLIQKDEHKREKEFIGIVKEVIRSEGMRKNGPLLSRIKKFLAVKEIRAEDAEIINYNDWLSKKIDRDVVLSK